MNRIKAILLSLAILVNFVAFADDQDSGPLGRAIKTDNVSEVKSMIESGEYNANTLPSLITPLGLAIESRSPKCIEYLLSLSNMDVHAIYKVVYVGGGGSISPENALYTAVRKHDIDTANKLLDMGCNADYYNKTTYADGTFREDQTTLMVAQRVEESKEALTLAQRIADGTKDINRSFSYQATEAERLTMQPTTNLLYKLISDQNDNKSFYNSVMFSLIERGAKYDVYIEPVDTADATIKQNTTAENYAAYKASKKYIYTSHLISAATTGNHEMMRYLIDKGVSIERYDDKGAVLFSACKTAECVKVMLEEGVDVNTCYPTTGMPLLFTSATSENYDLMEGLLKNGADPDITAKGYTINDIIRSYPKKRQKKVTDLIAKYKK